MHFWYGMIETCMFAFSPIRDIYVKTLKSSIVDDAAIPVWRPQKWGKGQNGSLFVLFLISDQMEDKLCIYSYIDKVVRKMLFVMLAWI